MKTYIFKHCQFLVTTSQWLSKVSMVSLLGLAITASSAYAGKKHSAIEDLGDINDVTAQLSRVGVMTLDEDLSFLSPRDRLAVDLIVAASKEIHTLYLSQQSPLGPKLYQELLSFDGGPNQPYLDLFRYHWNTWGEDYVPFINTSMLRAPGLEFYPKDMTEDEFTTWIENHPEDQAAFESDVTVIQRDRSGGLVAVPYSKFYKKQLVYPAILLKLAALATTDDKLANYLRLRAKAFKTNDYLASDTAWLDLVDSDIQVTIGPYETYEDELLGYKATFMSMVIIKDNSRETEVQYLTDSSSYILSQFDQILPDGPITILNDDGTPGESVNVTAANYVPIGADGTVQFVYANEIFSAGDYRVGATIGFFLPNLSSRVGYRNHILTNASSIKIDETLLPIASVIFANPSDAAKVNGSDFENNVTLHEYGHSLEPASVFNRPETSVDSRLLNQATSIHEPTADLFGLEFARFLIDRGDGNPFSVSPLENVYLTNIANLFREVRFGFNSSHARGIAMQLKWHIEHGAITVGDNGKVAMTSVANYQASINSLLQYLLTIQLTGDYQSALTLRQASIDFVESHLGIQQALTNIENIGIPEDFTKVYPQFDD